LESIGSAVVEASLDGCRAKHERGVKYLEQLNAEVSAYLRREPKPYRMRGEFDRDRRAYVLKGEVIEPLGDAMDWSLTLGDALHNLRSALDHLIFQLVVLNTGKKAGGGTMFPIASSGASYWSIAKDGRKSLRDRALKGVADEHRALIDALQPYRTREPGKGNFLLTLQALSNQDKHRLLNPLLYSLDAVGENGIRLTWNSDAGEIGSITAGSFPEEGEADIFVVEFSCPGENPEVSMHGEPPVSIGFGEPPIRAVDLLRLGVHVGEIIEAFARYF
jgi:hypothetical protein